MKNRLIGSTVKGIIDRPLGSHHPDYPDMIYPVNYGYVDGVMAGDGQQQDVYVLGTDQPLETFEGTVIAVYQRSDDCEDKWIVSVDESNRSTEEILEAIRFQERYFHGRLVRMDLSDLSEAYEVRLLTNDDVDEIYELCRNNELYYRYCPPFVTKESIESDLKALPPGKISDDKYFIGYFAADKLIAVMDLILSYPDEKTAFIGFFMTDASVHNKGVGSGIIGDLCWYLASIGFSAIRLGYISSNPQARGFWSKNGFRDTGMTYDTENYTVTVAQRKLTPGKMQLIEPTEEHAQQIKAYRNEFLQSGESMDGTGGLRKFDDPLQWLNHNKLMSDPATVPENLVCATQYIFLREEDQKIVGMLQIRHYLNDYLEKYAGHIGYSTAPSERRKGYASLMLKTALDKCRELGLDRVLITCNDDNEGSRRTIISNGGIYESTEYEPDDKEYIERYWISLKADSVQ